MSVELVGKYKRRIYPDAGDAVAAMSAQLSDSFKKVPRALRIELGRMLDRVATEMKQKHSKPWTYGNSPAKSLRRRSGKSLASILKSIDVSEGGTIQSVKGKIGGIGYLKIQENGGTIRAKKSKYLTIPTEYALDARGNPIKPRARDWKNTFIARSKKGNLIIFQNRAGGKPVPLYVLKKSVELKPRLGMRSSLEKHSSKMVERILREVDKLF